MVFSKNLITSRLIAFMLFFCFVGTTMAAARAIYKEVPQKIDPGSRYLFFLHGQIVENKGIRPTSEKYGTYEYRKILDTFKKKGFIVISEAT